MGRKSLAALAALAGLALALALIAANDARAILALMAAQGAGLLGIAAFHIVPLCFSAAAWRAVMPPRGRAGLGLFLQARLMREAVNDLLPVAHIGGVVAGARVLTGGGTPVLRAAGGAVVDQTCETLSQFLFALLGLALLAFHGNAPDLTAAVAGILALSAPLMAGLVIAQRAGLIGRAERLLAPLLKRFGLASVEAGRIERETLALYRRPGPLAAGFALHFLCWLAGAGEVWLALRLMGHEAPWRSAFILESLGQAVRSASFFMPFGLGVQEGGFVLLGAALGLPAPVALALSLVKRTREILLGVSVFAARALAGGHAFRLSPQKRAE